MVYVCIDCDKIQDYVFSSRRLRGIRNGSLLIDKADSEAKELVSSKGGETLRALGGVVIAKFPDLPKAEAFLLEARAHYNGYGIGMTTAVHHCSVVGRLYRDVLEPLLNKVRIKKDCREGVSLPPPTAILAATCEISGRGAAQGLVSLARDERLHRASDVEQTKWLQNLDPQEKDLPNNWVGRMPDTAEEVVSWKTSGKMADKEVPGTSEARLLGMVFADVNGVGKLLPHLANDGAGYSQFSRDLNQCLRQSLYEAVESLLEKPVMEGGKNQKFPFRLLFLGGDNLCYAAAGAYALPLTQKFIECFEERSQSILAPLRSGEAAKHLPPCLNLSAGVVLAPYNYPILSFRRLGRELESHAKQVGRWWAHLNNHPYPPSLVDFHLVQNATAGTIREIRHLLRTPYPVDGMKAYLFGGPYLISRDSGRHPAKARLLPLEDLLKAARDLAACPAGGKLQALRWLLSRSGAGGLYREWWDHLDDVEDRWRAVCQVLGVPAVRDTLPVRGTPHLNTPVLDALALIGLVNLQERWEV